MVIDPVTNERRVPVAVATNFNQIDMPRFSNAHAILFGLVQQIERVNSIVGELPGMDQVFRAISESCQMVVSTHWLMDVALNEYAHGILRRKASVTAQDQKDHRKIYRASLTSNKDGKPEKEKLKLFADFADHVSMLEPDLASDVKFVCDIRDIIYHFEAHPYESRNVPKVIEKISSSVGLPSGPDVGYFGPIAFVATAEFSNFVHRVLTRFLNALLSRHRSFAPRTNLGEILENNDLLLLSEGFDFQRFSHVVRKVMAGNAIALDPILALSVSRLEKGCLLFKTTAHGAHVGFYEYSTETIREVAAEEYQDAAVSKKRQFQAFPTDPTLGLRHAEILATMADM